eukprot:1157861-Pelagomonas_calceolata.AAC.2
MCGEERSLLSACHERGRLSSLSEWAPHGWYMRRSGTLKVSTAHMRFESGISQVVRKDTRGSCMQQVPTSMKGNENET